MPRFKLTIEYDGTDLLGWQKQNDGPSVQGAIEEAIYKISGEHTEVYGAGRTDAGVHATAQVAHVDINKEFTPLKLRDAVNAHLRSYNVAILEVEDVPDDFHARFSAIGREYIYKIITRRAPLAINKNKAWHILHELDVKAMHEAAQVLIGQHDFTSFRASACQANSPVKTLDFIEVRQSGELIEIELKARSFLHHQVRNIVGTLKLVGEGKLDKEGLKAILDAKDRSKAGVTAGAEGLYLTKVIYP